MASHKNLDRQESTEAPYRQHYDDSIEDMDPNEYMEDDDSDK